MKLKVLYSSSHGNCYILESPTGSLLLEAGIPWKGIQNGLNYDLSNVLGCLITHEHKDHSKSILEVIGAGIDCYISNGTAVAIGIKNTKNNYRVKIIKSQLQFIVGDFAVMPFNSEHDASEPLGFLIQYKPTKEKLLFITDSYYCKYKFKGLNYIMVECNYIKETLDANIEAGYIHEAMKSRLLQSHFSLENCKQFLMANDLSKCRKIILLHLSDSNSNALRMVKEIKELTGIKPVIADTGLEVSLEMFPY